MFIFVLVISGLCLGSFINALEWRLHVQNERGHKSKSVSILQGRSMCPNCKHQLSAIDLIPIVSWISLRGKCRYCHKSISWQYPLVELLTVSLFIFSYQYWPLTFHGLGLFEFVLWLIFLTGLVTLIIYDAKWYLLPNRIVYPLITLAVAQVAVVTLLASGRLETVLGALWGVIVLGGLFYGIFQISRGKWIGGGDVKLGILLGLLVGGPLESLLLLFLASAGGCLVVLPLIATGKAKRQTRLPFGPFLILAAFVVKLFGASIITWYKTHSGNY